MKRTKNSSNVVASAAFRPLSQRNHGRSWPSVAEAHHERKLNDWRMNNSTNVAMPTAEDGEIQEMRTNQVSTQQICKNRSWTPTKTLWRCFSHQLHNCLQNITTLICFTNYRERH